MWPLQPPGGGAVIDGCREEESQRPAGWERATEFARGSSCLRPEKLPQETPPPAPLTPRPPTSQATAALGQRHPRKACSEAATQWRAEPCRPPPSRLKPFPAPHCPWDKVQTPKKTSQALPSCPESSPSCRHPALPTKPPDPGQTAVLDRCPHRPLHIPPKARPRCGPCAQLADRS